MHDGYGQIREACSHFATSETGSNLTVKTTDNKSQVLQQSPTQ
jgi:hypothetical protein